MSYTDTIAAIATAPGAAGVAIIRISGNNAFSVAGKCIVNSEFGIRNSELSDQLKGGTLSSASVTQNHATDHKPLITGHSTLNSQPSTLNTAPKALYSRFRNPDTGEIVDDGIVLCFKAPHSYTGEDVVEFQGHGGRMPSSRVLRAVIAAGARMAEPGEFTRRAFLNGKMDLTRAEAVMDFIGATSDRAAASAREQLSGKLSKGINELFDRVITVEADVEHLLDFNEDEVPADFNLDAQTRLAEISKDLEEYIASWRHGAILREGALVVLSGKPNAGKSSLLNALLGKKRAIVSPIAGTTRDTIEEGLVINGLPVRLVDTAGLREAQDGIEAEGVTRAEELIQKADLVIHVMSTEENSEFGIRSSESEDSEAQLNSQLSTFNFGKNSELSRASHAIIAYNKCDLLSSHIPELKPNEVCVSALRGDGIEMLKEMIAAHLDKDKGENGDLGVSERHRACLEEATKAVTGASEALALGDGGLVIAAENLSQAADALGRITGRVWAEELLDAVFGKFCVGK